MNPLTDSLNDISNSVKIKNVIKMLRSGNPEQIAQNLMMQNPQFRSFMQQNQGKSPEQVAKEHGIDISQILDGFR